MSRTADRFPGTREEEEILFDDRTGDGDPTDERAMRYLGGDFRMKDSIGVFNPRDPGIFFLDRVISTSITVPGDKTWLAHDAEIADGVEILVLDGGEVLWL